MAPDSITVRDTPANGVVVVDVGCAFGNCFEGELPEELPVMDKTTGEMVPGAIVLSDGSIDAQARIAWKPDAPLVEGRTYEVMWQPEAAQSFAQLDYELLALAAATWTADDIAVTASESLFENATEYATCQAPEWINSCRSGGGTYTHYVGLNVAQQVAVQVAIDSEASPEGSEGQYAVAAAIWTEGEEQPELAEVSALVYSSIGTSASFQTASSAYCYRVEVRSLIDDTVAVTADCLPHTGGTLTSSPLSDSDIATQLGQCSTPPEDGSFDDLWCTGRRAYCNAVAGGSVQEAGCDTLDEQCRDVVDPKDPVDPNDPMDPGEPSDGDGGGDDDEMTITEPGLEGGCSAAADQRGRSWPSLVFATIFLAVRLRRARKSAEN